MLPNAYSFKDCNLPGFDPLFKCDLSIKMGIESSTNDGLGVKQCRF
jgi:hypothetical protein